MPITECVFTGIKAYDVRPWADQIEYRVVVNGIEYLIKIPFGQMWQSDPYFTENKTLIECLLWNNEWFENQSEVITIPKLKALIESKTFPKTPEEKKEAVFLKLFSFQKHGGDWVSFNSSDYELLWRQCYLTSNVEFTFYAEYLASCNLIKAHFAHEGLTNYRLTFDGYNYHEKITTEGSNSNNCFIAMQFRPEHEGNKSAIISAIRKTGFQPVIVDQNHLVENERTINDEIIASIKKSKFCIADFTGHSDGVYFEAGFALGQGKKVIYTCEKVAFKDAHFDLRPMQFILYETPEELERLLVFAIQARIK